jgi:hypothetical protein
VSRFASCAKDLRERMPGVKKIRQANRFFFIGLVLRRYLIHADAMADGFGKVQILGEPWYKLNTAIHAA